jgi:DNA-binding response OmpR family regulator
MQAKILLTEDDPNLGFVIKDNLEQKGYAVTLCTMVKNGFNQFNQSHYDLCILDVMMPKKDGFTLAKEIRSQNQQVPILFVTAKSMQEDKIEGFKQGVTITIVKPFSMEELCLRIEVFLRRSVPQQQEENFTLGDFQFDCTNFTLLHNNGEKTLTQKEGEVLKLLCKNKDRVLKREEILNAVWGNDDYFLGRSMDVFISKLAQVLKRRSARTDCELSRSWF